jgi:hypothetical protein
MPDDIVSSSTLVASGISLIAAFLGLRQWYEWRARDPLLSPSEKRYFRHQDIRRSIGVAVMLLLAAGIYVGSRIPAKAGNAANLAFLYVWLTVSGLLVVMLAMAMLDWIATRAYARRKRQSLTREQLRLIRDVAAARAREQRSEPGQANEA